MTVIGIEELREKNLRVKLANELEKKFWEEIRSQGGIKNISQDSEYSATQIYNWKNKEMHIPLRFIEKIITIDQVTHINSVKGEGKSKKWDFHFPVNISNELLNRVDASVSTNKEGTPFYITKDEGLLNRFKHLLDELKIPYSIYRNQDRFELRYPKYINQLILSLDFEIDVTVLADEKGVIKKDKIVLKDREIDLKDTGRLYSRDKRLEKALKTGESNEVENIIKEQVTKVKSALE